MYKKDKRNLFIIFVLSVTATYFLKLNLFDISSDILSVISIILGFYFTALSVQIGNKMTVRMSHTEDVEYTSLSQLKVLMNYFKFVFLFGFSGIMLIIFARIIPQDVAKKYVFVYKGLEAFTAGIIAVVFAASYIIFQIMVNSIQEEAVRLYQESQHNDTD